MTKKRELATFWLIIVSAPVGVLIETSLPDGITESSMFTYSLLTILVLSTAVIIGYTLRVSNDMGKEHSSNSTASAPASDSKETA